MKVHMRNDKNLQIHKELKSNPTNLSTCPVRTESVIRSASSLLQINANSPINEPNVSSESRENRRNTKEVSTFIQVISENRPTPEDLSKNHILSFQPVSVAEFLGPSNQLSTEKIYIQDPGGTVDIGDQNASLQISYEQEDRNKLDILAKICQSEVTQELGKFRQCNENEASHNFSNQGIVYEETTKTEERINI